MLISQSWITRILHKDNPSWTVSAEEFDAGIVRVGFETEGYESIPETTGPLVFGRVESYEELEGFKKPIRYCEVSVGDANGTGEAQHIICGARNFVQGDIVIVALPGTVLPGPFEISARKTYGKISEGMMCSAAELGLAEQSPGIIALRGQASEGIIPGEDARSFLGIQDTVFDINITPDRGYALSARGIAREAASAFSLSFRDPAHDPAAADLPVDLFAGLPGAEGEVLSITVDEETACQRFGVRKVEGIDPDIESPFWLQRELMLCGQRPVNAATDVTNYIMFLLGQPMHAFDADKISGTLRIRHAESGEIIRTLDGVERKLEADDVVISDEKGIQSLAGILGGSTSEISDSTRNIYFEAATWNPLGVARSARRHKVSTEASRRFERGVDPALVESALDYAAALLVRIAGGRVVQGRSLVGECPLPDEIRMHTNRPGQVAGMTYPAGTTVSRLEEVGCTIRDTGLKDATGAQELAIRPPTWRPDLTMAADLVEEVLRLEGLDDIPELLPKAPAGHGLSPRQKRRRAVGHALAWQGYAEIIPTPFIRAEIFDDWGLDAEDPRRRCVTVLNPLESDYRSLGTTLLPSMIEALRRNVSRGQKDLALYGIGQVTIPTEASEVSPMPSVQQRPSQEDIDSLHASLPVQPVHVAMIATGDRIWQSPHGAAQPYTVADSCAVAQIIARAVDVEIELRNVEYLPWHPGRCAEVFIKGTDIAIGYAGELHPQVCEKALIPPRSIAVEISLDAIPLQEKLPRPVLSAYPALLQDLALVVDEDIPVAAITEVLSQGAGELMEDIRLFDVYQNEALASVGKRSLTFSLRFRASDRTLTDEEVNEWRLAALKVAEESFGAELRM